MTTIIPPVRAGLILGSFIGGLHFIWALIVASGFVQPLIDFIFWMHFIKPVYIVQSFGVWAAFVLVGLTGLTSHGIGWFFAVLWNGFHRKV
jgi:hypothetical protein